MPTTSDDYLLSIISKGPDIARSHLRSISKTVTNSDYFSFLLTQKADFLLNHASENNREALEWVDIAIESLTPNKKTEDKSTPTEELFRDEFSIIRLRIKCIQKFGVDVAPDCLRIDRLRALIAHYTNVDEETYNSEASLVIAFTEDSTNHDLRRAILELRHLRQIANLVSCSLDKKFAREHLPSLSKYIKN